MRKNRLLVISGLFAVICTLAFPADYREVVNSGVILLQQGMSKEAIRIFESARSMQPSSSEAYYYLGEAYYSEGKRTEALENYNKAVELQGTNPDYHYSIALLHLSEGKTEDAVAKLNKVIEIAPLSLTGKYAGKLKDAINADRGNKEMIQKWLRIEEERRKQLELEQQEKAKASQGAPEGMPPEFAGMIPGEEQKKEEIAKIPIEQLMKRIRFGTATVRLRSSSALRAYEQVELVKVSPDIMELTRLLKEPPVRKNLIYSLGKAATPEAVTAILNIIQDKNELYDIKIASLESIGKVKTQEVAGVLRNLLNAMVEKRIAERAAAKKNIEEIKIKQDTLAARKIKLNNEISQDEQKKSEIDQKLQVTDLPPEFMMMPPGTVAPQGTQKPLTEKEILKLREDSRKIEESVLKKREEVLKIDRETADLEKQKARYVALLQEKEKKITDVTMPIVVQPAEPTPDQMMMPGMMPGMEQQQYTYQETDEDKNEVIFAFQAMRALGEIRDKEGLPVVKKGWDEYGIEKERIYHLLTLARMGDFTGIKILVNRLKEDYPQDPAEEIRLRTGIIEIVGEYIAKKPDAQMQGLIEFLSEEGAYPEIKEAASNILTATAKPAPEKKKPEKTD